MVHPEAFPGLSAPRSTTIKTEIHQPRNSTETKTGIVSPEQPLALVPQRERVSLRLSNLLDRRNERLALNAIPRVGTLQGDRSITYYPPVESSSRERPSFASCAPYQGRIFVVIQTEHFARGRFETSMVFFLTFPRFRSVQTVAIRTAARPWGFPLWSGGLHVQLSAPLILFGKALMVWDLYLGASANQKIL